MKQRGEAFRAAVGAGIVLGLCNPFIMPVALTLLAVLWLLQRPAPTVWTGVAAAPKPIRWATANLWAFIQSNVEHSRRTADLREASKDKLLYHVAIGSNCNKEVLEGRRNVKPRKSMPCRIEGYELTFNHRGLPYWEPSFCTIAKAEDVKTAEEINGTESPAAPPDRGPVPGASPLTRSAARAAKSAKQGAAAATNGMIDSPGKQANGTATNGAAANGVIGSDVNGSAVSRRRAESRTNGRAMGGVAATKRSPTVLLWRGLVRLGSLLLGPAPEPVAARKYKGPNGRPELHGVVHQITEADMKQIQITEGGGGNRKMGYQLEEMTCTLYDGSRVQALGFTTHPCSRTCPTLGFAHPSERYLQIVRVGIAASGIDKAYQDWLEELQPYRRETWGQLIGSYVVVAMMFAAGGVVAAALAAHRLLLRRKFDGGNLHVLIQHIMSAVWWSHNHVLAHVFGRGS